MVSLKKHAKKILEIFIPLAAALFAVPVLASGSYSVYGGGAGSLSGTTMNFPGGYVNDAVTWTSSGTFSVATISALACGADFTATFDATGDDYSDAHVTVAGTTYAIDSVTAAGGCKSRDIAQGGSTTGIFTKTGDTVGWTPSSDTNAFYSSYTTFRLMYCGLDISSGSISHRNCIISPQFTSAGIVPDSPIMVHPGNLDGVAYVTINATGDTYSFTGTTGTPTATGTGSIKIWNDTLAYQCTMSGTVSASLVDGRSTGLNLGRTVDGSTSGGQCGVIPYGTYHAQMTFVQSGQPNKYSEATQFVVSATGSNADIAPPGDCSTGNAAQIAICFTVQNAKYLVVPTNASIDYLMSGGIYAFGMRDFLADYNSLTAVCPLTTYPQIDIPSFDATHTITGYKTPEVDFCTNIYNATALFRSGVPQTGIAAVFAVIGVILAVTFLRIFIMG